MPKQRILAIAHDAGGADVLASLMSKYRKKYDWRTILEGPALEKFKSRGLKDNYSQNRVLDKVQPDFIITGTSKASDLEKVFLKKAKKKGIPCASFLDHWVNYEKRFFDSSSRKISLPDFIFVGDEYADALARKKLNNAKVCRVENPVWDKYLDKASKRLNGSRRLKVLYIGKGQNDESDVERILEALSSSRSEVFVRLRSHPDASGERYKSAIKNWRKKDLRVEKSKLHSLEVADLQWADAVIGFENMPLALAAVMGKKAISMLSRAECRLPQQEIIKVGHSNAGLIQALFHGREKSKKRNRFNIMQRKFNQKYPFERVVNQLLAAGVKR